MTAVSDQTRRNRSEAGRKAAEAKKRKRVLGHFLATGTPVGPPEFAPGGRAVGAERHKVQSISQILARFAAIPTERSAQTVDSIPGRVAARAGRDGGGGASGAAAVPLVAGKP